MENIDAEAVKAQLSMGELEKLVRCKVALAEAINRIEVIVLNDEYGDCHSDILQIIKKTKRKL